MTDEMESSYDKVSDIIKEGKSRAGMFLDMISVFENYSRDLLNMSEEQKRNFDLMQSMVDDAKLKHKQIFEELQVKNEQLRVLEKVNHALIAKEQLSRDELHEIGKNLIKGFNDTWGSRWHNFGIKQMGRIDKTVFLKACRLKFLAEEALLKASKLHSSWQDKLVDPKWHPFNFVEVGEGNYQEVVNEKDRLLKDLKNEWGEDIYNAVMTAFKELKEYNPQFNPGGRYTVPELWNFRDNRKANPNEIIPYIFKEMNPLKRKKTPTEHLNNTKKASTDQEMSENEENVKAVFESSDDEVLERAESKEKPTEPEQESNEDEGKKKQTSSERNGSSAAISKVKEVKVSKKPSPPEKSLPKLLKRQLIENDDSNKRKVSGKNKGESIKKPIPKESAKKESSGKNVVLKVKEKTKNGELSPTDEELRNAISEILKEINFNTATFTDLLKLLVKKYDEDLTPRKSTIKQIIQDELNKLADAEVDDS